MADTTGNARLERLGWNEFFRQQLTGEATVPVVARVVEEQRGTYRVSGEFDGWAEISGRFRHSVRATADYPTVGDWVCLSVPVAADRAIITRLLERRSTISRKIAGRVVEEQVMAANVDTIFLVTSLTEDLNPRRIERYLTVVRDAGAVPVIILNKSDLSTDPESEAAQVRARLPLVDVLAVSAREGQGFGAIDAYLAPAQTVALIGSSGVGKSTLINRLVGQELLKTGAVREDDRKGRHTTTARHLVELPGGALLIDTPGMRELQPWVDESAVEQTFEDIAQLASQCKFSDCGHASEPGCAVLAAVETGALDPERLEHYRHLSREIAFEERKRDKAAAAAEKRRWKKIHQAVKQMYRERDKT